MLVNSLFSFMGTLSFAILFNIKGKKLFFAALGGGISWFFYLLFLSFNGSPLESLFFASIVGGIFSEIMARLLKTPVTTFVICTVIPLVPGSGMYYTMLETIQGNINKSLSVGLETIASAGAIAVGLVFVSSLAKLLNFLKSKKHLVK
jgi:uncharacterized membrane protein YjjB (DUF3815 family)